MPLWGRKRAVDPGADRAGDRRVEERQRVLARAAEMPPQWLTQYGARTGSRWAADVFAWLLTEGASDAAGLLARLGDGRSPAKPEGRRRPVDPNLLTRYVRMLAFSREVPHEEVTLLLDHLAPRLEKARLTPNHRRVLAQLYAGAGRYADMRRAMQQWPETPDVLVVRRLLEADAISPWRVRGAGPTEPADDPAPDETGWTGLVDSVYAPSGPEPLRLVAEGPTPFDRLAAPLHPGPAPAGGPVVSVIMSCFRPGPATVAAARSIAAQTWPDWELLVLDDASGPAYEPVLEEVAALDPRVRVLRAETNAGTYVRRNDGLAAARGEFVTMHDSDDWAHPRRLEAQVRHALEHPEAPANVIAALRATDDMVFGIGTTGRVTYRVAETSLFFRRGPTLERIGYYDTVRRAADREYRFRLETAFGAAAVEVETGGPLEVCRLGAVSLSSPDFDGVWVHPARMAYRGAFTQWHRQIAAGQADPRLDREPAERAFPAPARLVDGSGDDRAVDVLVLLDARPAANPDGFLDTVADELAAVLVSGRTAGVAHVESLAETAQDAVLPEVLQALVNDGSITQVLLDGDTCAAGRVVVRTMSVLQGQPARRLPVTTGRVVLVEDRVSGRDRVGDNVALAEVVAGAEAMFAVPPEHLVADDPAGLAQAYAAASAL